MDLHLVRPGGTLQGNGGCYCRKHQPRWGVFGDSTVTLLDLDDISGTGPENINIEYPENGIFTVYVHDFTYSTGDSPSSNLATVNIYIGGSLEWTGQYNFRASDEGQYIPRHHQLAGGHGLVPALSTPQARASGLGPG